MIQFNVIMKSAALQTRVHVNVLLPEVFDTHRFGELMPLYPFDTKFKTLYLLHGAYDDSTCWIRRTNIEKIADEKGFAVVMPEVGNSFYCDMVHGPNWYTFMTEELPQAMRRNFPLSDRKEDNFMAGLSMGGYGTMMISLNHPERFQAVASMSGALNMARQITDLEQRIPVNDIWGSIENYKGSQYDIIHMLEKAKNEGVDLPRMFQVVGTEDFLYDQNMDFKHTCEKLGIPVHYEELPGGHDWAIWRKYLPIIVDWMFDEK
ncbi:alpha/beta hydrolase family protein [Anaerolentibacter hominis]|uniref:alpha/beta hydrolase n=1 Tax=Anaerolentibacter hominis TaxID=3079009 RepID=UPI0031B89338